MWVSQRSGLFSGVAALACATVLLEITLTRIFAALFGGPYAFLALALAPFGAGVGGVLLHLAPSIARPPSLFARMAALSSFASGATLAAVILLAQRGAAAGPAPRSLLWLALLYAASAVPFALAGLAVAAAIRHAAAEMPRLHLLSLVGGALGGLAAAAALRAGAPRAALAAAIFFAVAGVFFYLASRVREDEPRASGGLVATFVLGSAVLLAGDIGAPWLRLTGLRGAAPELESWSEQALITVERARAGTAWMRRDGAGASAILAAKTQPPPRPEDMAYALHRDRGPVLVVGAGGGRDLRAALKAGQKEVHAVEESRDVVEAMRGRYAEFSGHLFDRPEVRVAVTDGRSFIRRTPLRFRHIVIASTDAPAGSTVGALALSESRLHTLEGLSDFLARLAPEGTLVVTRADGDFDRLLSLAAAALRRAGAGAPGDHLFGCGAAKQTALLVKRAPLARAEIDALRRHCRRHRFSEAFAPDRPRTPARGRLVATADARAAAPDARVDLTPPTDDRPFFSYSVPARRLPAVLGDLEALRAEHAGLSALLALLAGGSGLLALGVLLPLLAGRLGPRAAAPAPRARALLFFAAIGAGFALVGLALVRHALVLLDLPAHELPAVLVVLLVSVGGGGLLTARVAPPAAAGAAATLAALLVAAAALAAVGLVPLTQWSLGLAPFLRAALAVVVLAPVGLLAGSLAPLGVKLVASRSPALLPWCFGLSALAGAVAMAVGALCAMNLGYSALLLCAGLAYLLAAAVPPAAAAGEVAPDDEAGAQDGAGAAMPEAPPAARAAGARSGAPGA
ncbi:hypothetical protein WMF31_17160 [Sorangium sp. So ce1036]|uniref:spermidine synthase n=1 Tax=Sorangium sp. So ce1036 TaxID=3133328 RepID=UPI003EFF0B9E